MKNLAAIDLVILVMIRILSFASDEVIAVVSDCWEPYTCSSQPGRNGIAVDIFMTIFRRIRNNLQ